MKKRIPGLTAVILGIAASALAQPAVFIVRHAERADSGAAATMSGADPELSAAGQARAAALAEMLRNAKLTAIYATQFKRTHQTAAPAAKAAGLSVTTVPADDPAALIEKVRASTGNVLVVGHSNTVPDILRRLGIDEPIAIADAEYDNLFVVVLGPRPTLVRLRFPRASVP